MLRSLTVADLDAWREFDIDEPIGPREHRQQMAQLLAMVANRWRKKGTQAVTAEEFLIRRVADIQKAQSRQLIDTLRGMGRLVPERPRHRKHPKSAKASAKAQKRKAAGK